MEEKVHALKYTAPTKFDHAPYGEEWVQYGDGNVYMWIQASKSIDQPNWISSAQLLDKVFSDKLAEPGFIKECLETYNK